MHGKHVSPEPTSISTPPALTSETGKPSIPGLWSNTSPHEDVGLDPSGFWWGGPSPTASLGFAAPRLRREPHLGLSVALFLISIVLSPFGIACCWLAHAELRGMKRGTVTGVSRDWFVCLRLWGVFASCLAFGLLSYLVASA
jgi:hypothetical protein